MRLKFTLLFLSTLLACSLVSAQTTALSFNAANQDVAATSAYVVPSGGADFTVEFWFNIPSIGSALMEFVSQGNPTTGFYIGTNYTTGQFRAGDAWPSTGVNVPLNQWVHLALTSASGTATLYLNGVQMAQQLATPNPYTFTSGGTPFQMGSQFTGYSEWLTGSMQQTRVWNVALTQAQIKQTMYGTVSPSATGLVADYEMNDGSGTTVANSTSTTGLNATLSSSDATNAAWVSSPVVFGDNALSFDGASTAVVAPSSTAFELSSGTIEAEINPTSWPVDGGTPRNMAIAAYRSPGLARYSFHVSSIGVGFYNGSNFYVWDYTGTMATTNPVPYTIPLGSWTQLSWVTDGANITLYVNGTSVGSYAQTFGTATGLTFDIGVTENGSPGEWFDGSIDEVRVWNTQQTPVQINQYLGKTLTGTETGLNALYSFDQGVAGGTNTGLITAIDNTANSNNATLSNFALTGATSNFVTSAIIPLPVNFTSFTATKSGSQALLQWITAQEENSHDFSIERSTDGATYTSIGDVPAAGNSAKPTSYSFVDPAPKTGLNYYRLKETDAGGQFMYSEVKTVTFPTSSTQQLVWYTVSSQSIEVSLNSGSNEYYTLFDMNGRTIQKGQLSAGKLYLSNLTSGMYIVNVNTFTGQQLTTKVLMP